MIQLNLPGLDFDTVCVTRLDISPKMFLVQLIEELKRVKCPNLEEYHIIDFSGSQHLELIFNGSTFRLSFACLNVDELPARITAMYLVWADSTSFFNIGYTSNLDYFSTCCPDVDLDDYFLTLSTIKLWAKRRIRKFVW